MAIKFNWKDLQKRVFNGVEAEKVMLNWIQIRPETTPPTPVYPIESIVVKVRAYNNWELYIPISRPYWAPDSSYNWNVSIDGWTNVSYSGTTSYRWYITIGTWYAWNSEHIVVITPVTVSYWWAKAFNYYSVSINNSLREVIQDMSYIWYAESATNTWDWFRAYQYYYTPITTFPDEVLPNTVTTIWDWFRAGQYNLARWDQMTAYPAEVLPSSVTSIWDHFRDWQYATSHTQIPAAAEVLPSSVTWIWTHFRNGQYNGSQITAAATEVLPDSVTTIWVGFRHGQYGYCRSLTAAAAEARNNTITSIPDDFRSYQYYSSSIQSAQEYLPNTVTQIWNEFRCYQYADTFNLTTPPAEVIPSSVSSIWNWFRWYQYTNSAITTTAVENIPGGVTVSYWYRIGQYEWCYNLISTAIEVVPDVFEASGYREYQYQNCGALETAYLTAVSFPEWYTVRYFQFNVNWGSMHQNLVVTISWNVVDQATFAAWLDTNNCSAIRVPSSLVTAYKESEYWSSVSSLIVWY